MTGVLIRDKAETQTHRDGGRDSSAVAACQGTPDTVSKPPEARK